MESQDDIRALESRANAHLNRGEFEAALLLFAQLAERGEADDYVWCHTGDALCGLGEYVEARHAYEQALKYAPDQPALHINLARALFQLGEADAAAAHLEFAFVHGRPFEAMERLSILAPGVPGFDLRKVLEVRRTYGEMLARRVPEIAPPPAVSIRDAEGRIRVAYLSAHFDQRGYMGPVWALINNHDRRLVDVVLLSDGSADPPFPDYAPSSDDAFCDVSALDDEALARRISDLGIDILVDLSGYSYVRRLSLFTRRVAPRVVTWFNMYATSGLPGIDYIIGDAQVARPGDEVYYTEKVLRLPQSYLTFQGWEDRPSPALPPCAGGHPFTFGSLVSRYKITPPVLDAWAEILRGAPPARLLIGNGGMKSPANRDYLLRQFQERGVDPSRIDLRGPAPHAEFLGYYDAMDVALDAFPYSGGTTTMEAIWQGVPVLTQAGDRWAARTTGSILADTHLGDFCCPDVDVYVARAVEIALDPDSPDKLGVLRREMRHRLRTSRALDAEGLARHMEALYRRVIETPSER